MGGGNGDRIRDVRAQIDTNHYSAPTGRNAIAQGKAMRAAEHGRRPGFLGHIGFRPSEIAGVVLDVDEAEMERPWTSASIAVGRQSTRTTRPNGN